MATAAPVKQIRKSGVRGLHARDLVILLSFANLCYFRVWHEVESFDMSRFPAMKTLPSKAALMGVMLNVLLLGLALTALVALFRRREHTTANKGRIVFLLMLGVPLTGVYRVISERHQMMRGELIRHIGTAQTAALYLVAAAIFVTVAWHWHAALARWASVLLIIFSPGVLLTFGKAIVQMSADPSVLADRPSPPPSATARKDARVIWVIFDEWDYRLSFVDRKADLALPEMDRMAQTALTATDALPPARATMLSVPMLLTGERYETVQLDGPSRMLASPVGEPSRSYDWSKRRSIFTEARAMNYNTALEGWYLPYCRVIADELNACGWQPLENQRNSVRRDSVWHAMVDETRSLLETSLLSPFGQSLATEHHAQTYHQMLERAIALMRDPTFGVVFVHMPIPHTPFFYDRASGTDSAQNSAVRRYYDALALLDKTIGEFRRQMEAAGQWDNSTVLFTTDHYYRTASVLDGKMDSRVPFLLKLPGQTHGVRYEARFNTVVTKEMLLAILRREIQSPEDAARWLHQHGMVAPPVNAPAVE